MNIVVIPGIHAPSLTREFVKSLNPLLEEAWIVPEHSVPVYSPQHVFTFLQQTWSKVSPDFTSSDCRSKPLIFIGFSAGVVGSLGAARLWQAAGNRVLALIALDGWGVPLYGEFPIHRVSHDFWTHWSSGYFGNTQESFYVEPAIEHLELWRSPHTASGICTSSKKSRPQQPETAATFVRSLIKHYGEYEEIEGKPSRLLSY